MDLTGPTCHVDLSKPGMCARVFSFKGSSAVVEVTVVLDFPDPAAQPLLLFEYWERPQYSWERHNTVSDVSLLVG